MDKLVKWLENLLRAQKKSRAWRTFVSCLAAIVVFTTTYSLILPAITVEQSATEDVGGLVLDEADPGSTGAEAEAPGEVVTVDADNETSDEVPDEAVQEEAPAADEEAADTAATEETASENKTTQSAASQTETTQTSESKAAVAEEVREPVNGEVQTIGDKRVMTLTGEDFDVIVSGDLSVGVSDRTVLSVRGIPDAEVVKSFSDRISDELLKIFVDKKTTEILYQLVFTDENLVEYTPAGYFDVQFIFHNNTVSHTGEKIYAAIYDYLTDEMVLAEKNGDAYETPVIALDEYGIIKGITLKGMHFDEYSDIITLVAGPVNEELKLAAEKAANGTATESKAGSGTKPAESKAEKTESGKESAESKTEKTESTGAKTDSAESKSEGPSAKAETSKGSEETGTGTLTARGSDYTVTLAYGSDAKIPDGASLDVTEIENGTKAYKKYLKQAKAAMGLDEDQELPKEQARFFDIKIMVDGKEIQPSANVSVNITYDQPVVKAVPNTEAQIDASAVHFGKEGTEVVEVSDVDASCVEFEAGSFSVYGVIYTVDFEYEWNGEMYRFSLSGGEKIALSELVEVLGILSGTNYESVEEFIADVEDVTFSNPELVKVTKKEKAFGVFGSDDWVLESLQPFNTEETLTITMKDGNVITVKVTDDQVSYNMKDAVSSVSADGLSGSTWTVKEGEQYTIHLSFEETPSVVQFPTTSNTLEYQLPNNFKPNGTLNNEPVTLTYTEASVTHTITGCTYSVDANGKVTINLTDFAKEKLAESGDGKLNINITGVFTETNEHTDFGGGNIKNITVDNTKNVTVNKSGSYNSSDNKVHYTVTVKADGSLTNVKVSDIISGSALTMDQDSLVIKNNSSTPTGGANANGFDLTFPTMKNGETITIEYTASVNWNEIGDGKGTIEQTGNTVKVKPDGIDEKTVENNLENRITYNALNKQSGAVQNDPTDPDTKLIPWTITVNAQGLKNMKNTTITDYNQSPSVMHYAGNGIKIDKIDPATGSSVAGYPKNVSWDELGIDPDSDTSWSYKITDDGKYKYVITYYTEADVSGKNGYTSVSNNVSDDKGDGSGGGASVPPGSAQIGVDKQFGTATKDEMTWTVTMDVPATGLNKAILIDTLPSSGSYQDTLNVESLNVTGLENGDSYELTQSKGKFTLTFYKDEEHTTPGLNATGRARQITVTFKTDNDPLWVTNNRDSDHRNSVSFQGDNATVTDSDTGKVAQTGIEKNSNGYKTVTINGEKKLVFEYTIDLYGVTDADFANGGLVVTDDYDQNYVQFLDLTNSSSIDGLDVYWAQQFQYSYGGERGPHKITPANDGDKLTFTIQKTDLPLNNGSLFKAYRLKYYMVAKDSSALLAASLAKDDHIITIDNKVKWGDSEDEVKVDYSYPGLVKTNVAPSTATDSNSTYNSETGTTGFKIVINPDQLELNNGETMVLEDVFSGNLSVDYSSIKITVEGVTGDQTVTYDYRGNKGTYYIPDKCKVTIEYDARVIGNPGEWVSYGNEATMNGYTDSASGRAWMGGGGDGGFNIYSIELFKYSAGHMEQGLNGATFTLVDENGDPVVYPDSAADESKRGKPITFTTATKNGKDGYVTVSLNEQTDGISLQKGITYYLKETVSPSTHAINNVTYRFTISDNPNYANYEYHSGDIVKVYDWPIQGRIEINKEIEGPSNLTEEDKEKIKFEITGNYPDGTPIKVDTDGYAIEQSDLARYTAEEIAELDEFKVEITYADFTSGKYTMADLVDGTYTVKETAAALPGYNDVATVSTTYEVNTDGTRVNDNETTAGTEATVTITDHSKYVMNYKNTYTNHKDYDLSIVKVDKDNTSKHLYGAVFRIEKKVGDDYQVIAPGSVDENGNFTIPYENKDTGVTLSGLEPGEYRITEVKAPTNYKTTGNGIIEFTIESDGTVTTTSGSNPMEYEYTADTSSLQLAGTFVIKNEVKHSYTITKVDGGNVSLKLPGAKFGVWESNYPAIENIDDAMAEDAAKTSNPLLVYTTDENGRFEIQKEDSAQFQDGKIYFVKEIEAPTGYELPDPPVVNYFFFSYNGTAPTKMKPSNLGAASRSQTLTNDLPHLEVKKVWKNLKGDNLNKQDIDVDSIDFVVYQQKNTKNSDGDLVPIEGSKTQFPDAQTTYTIEYVSGNWTTVSIPNAPAMGKDDDGNLIYYTYEIEEDTPEGWVSSVAMSDSGREATITNTPEPMEITVRKVWDAPESMASTDVANNHVIIRILQQQDDGSWKTFVVNGTNEQRLSASNDYEMTFEVEAGKVYTVEEVSYQFGTKTSGFSLSYEVEIGGVRTLINTIDEPGTMILTNTYEQPYLEIRKVWETDDDTSKLYPNVDIYRRVVGTENWTLWKSCELKPNENWSKTYYADELDTDENYEYYVRESKIRDEGNGWADMNPNPFEISYSSTIDDPLQKSGTIAVTNTKYDGEISVQKNWVYTDGSTAAKEGDTARVVLQRALADKEGQAVTVLLKDRRPIWEWDGSANANVITGYSYSIKAEKTLFVETGSNIQFVLGSQGDGTFVSYSINGVEQSSTIDYGTSYSLNNITEDTYIEIIRDTINYMNGSISITGKESTDINISGSYTDVPGTTVTLDSGNNWSHTWNNLPLDAGNNQEYVYSVREIQVNGKALSSADFTSSVTGDGVQQGSITVTNTEIAKGSLKITKNVTVGGSPTTTKKADGTYTFRINDHTGKRVGTAQITITNGVSDTVEVTDLAEGYYTITETASTNPGVTIDMEPKTVHVTGGKSGAQVLETGIAIVTNDYSANGSVDLTAKKIFEDHTLAGDDFDFSLTEYTNSTFGTAKPGGVSQTKHNDASGDVTFDPINYTISDAGASAENPNYYYYIIKETPGTETGITYDDTEYKVTVAVYDNGDGTLNVTKSINPSQDVPEGYDAVFTNTESQPGALSITKQVLINGKDPSGETRNLADGTYTFEIAGPSPSTTVIKFVQITVTNGTAESYKVADTEDALDSAESVSGAEAIVTGLAEGNYTISEIAPSSPMQLIAASRGDNASNAVSSDKAVTVHVTAGDTTAAQSDAQATFVNDYTRVEVTKIWKNDSSGNEEWPSDVSITLKLHKKVGSGSASEYLTLTVPKPTGSDPVNVTIAPATSGVTATVQQKTATASDGYIVKVDGLPSKEGENLIVYTFTEEPVANYNTTYSLLNGETPASTSKPKDSAGDGEAIVNVPVTAVTLPSTGGPGTRFLTILGSILIASAGALLLLRRRRLTATPNPPKRGGDPRI